MKNRSLVIAILIILVLLCFTVFDAGAYSGPFEQKAPPKAEGAETNMVFEETVQSKAIGLWEKWLASATESTNWTWVAYATWAPDIRADDKFGGGAMAVHEVSKYVGAGLGFDYLGSFSLVSGNVEIKAPIKISGVSVTPFGIGGVGVAVTGDDNEGGSLIAGGGVAVSVYSWDKGVINIGYAGVNWFNDTDYQGFRHQAFVAAKLKF